MSHAQSRWIFVSVIVLLQVPWAAQTQNTGEMLDWFAFSAIAAAYVAHALGRANAAMSALCAVAVFATLCELSSAYAAAQRSQALPGRSLETAIDARYPQAGWKRLVDESIATESLPAWLMRVPTWSGLLILMTGGVCASLRFRVRRPAGS